MAKHDDDALERLLDLHGWTAEVGGGFWVSFKVRAGEAEPGRPHGITYSLTMHQPGGERILGYDNAHVAPAGRGPAAKSRRREQDYDHRHRRSIVTAYKFESASKLLEDFWRDVEDLLDEEDAR